jgi:hypothetical protein
MTTRKQIDQLTAADFGTSPVWEFASDEEGEPGQDECTVRPCRTSAPVDASAGMFVIRSTFTLADGSTAVGYVTPPYEADDDLGAIQPVFISGDGQIMFWWGILEPQREWIDAAYAKLGRDSSAVFPIRFLSDIDSTNGPISGTIPGFMQMGDNGIKTIR